MTRAHHRAGRDAALRAPITFNDRELVLTASTGLALSDGEAHRAEEVLKDAELAMYHAKRIGGDRIEVFKPSMRARKTDRGTLEADLRRALEREEIAIFTSRSCGSRTARSPDSRRCRAGTTPRPGASRLPSSSPSPRRSA